MRLLGCKAPVLRFAENGVPVSFESVDLPSQMQDRFRALAAAAKERPFVLRGSRADTLAVLSQMKDAGVIVFDAHACSLFAAENDKVTHDFFMKNLLNIIPGNRVILVGHREFTYAGEAEFLKKNGVRIYSMQSLTMDSVESVCDGLMEIAKDWPLCYVSVCLDVLDPVFAKVEHPSPGGLSVRELLYFVQRLRMLRNFTAADVVDGEGPVVEKLLVEFAAR